MKPNLKSKRLGAEENWRLEEEHIRRLLVINAINVDEAHVRTNRIWRKRTTLAIKRRAMK